MINYTSDDDNRHDPAKAEALETEAALRVIYEAHPEYNPKYERDALVREVALRKHILEQEKEIEKLMVGLEVEKEEVRRRDGWVRDMEEAMGVVTNVLVKQIGELVEARGELAKAREDTARLDWMESSKHSPFYRTGTGTWEWGYIEDASPLTGETLRQAIDATREKGGLPTPHTEGSIPGGIGGTK